MGAVVGAVVLVGFVVWLRRNSRKPPQSVTPVVVCIRGVGAGAATTTQGRI